LRKPFTPQSFSGPRPSGPRPFGPRGPREVRDPHKNRKQRINDEITSTEVRVVDSDGKMLGVMNRDAAIELAYGKDMDLVEIAPQAAPPVCKIIEYGKFAYEIQKKENLAKKAQKQQELKEIRFKAGTDTHDFNFKTRHAREFLEDGDKVKATVMFRGREIVHPEFGRALLEKFVAELADVSKIDQPIKPEGKTMSVMLSPEKKAAKKAE